MNSLPNLAINLHLAKILMRTQAIPAQKIKKNGRTQIQAKATCPLSIKQQKSVQNEPYP